MTDLQVKYWQTMENARHNIETEKVGESQRKLNEANVNKVAADIVKIIEDAKNIAADTSLTEEKRTELMTKAWNDYANATKNIKLLGAAKTALLGMFPPAVQQFINKMNLSSKPVEDMGYGHPEYGSQIEKQYDQLSKQFSI